ncbi:HPr family phosphocarrier protein, partial [Georgenia subflava]
GGADAAAVARTVAEAAGSFGGGASAAAPPGAAPAGGEPAHEAGASAGAGPGAAAAEPGTEPAGAGHPESPAQDGEVLARSLTLHNEVGLHARPAALLARLVAGFDARVTVNEVDAASVLALMGLGLEKGDRMEVRAGGTEAAAALEAVEQAVADGFGEQ